MLYYQILPRPHIQNLYQSIATWKKKQEVMLWTFQKQTNRVNVKNSTKWFVDTRSRSATGSKNDCKCNRTKRDIGYQHTRISVCLYVCLIKKLKVKDLVWKVLCWFSHFHRRFPLMPSCLYITVLLQGYGGNDCKRFALTMSSISPVTFNACSFIFNKGQISLYKESVMSSGDMIGPSVLRFNRIHCVFSLCV